MLASILVVLTLTAFGLSAHLSTLESATGPLRQQAEWLHPTGFIVGGVGFHLLVAGAVMLSPALMLASGLALIVGALAWATASPPQPLTAVPLLAGVPLVVAAPIWWLITTCGLR